MPLPNIPQEIRSEYENIYEKLSEKFPEYPPQELANASWNVVKKIYFRAADGKWRQKDGIPAWISDPKNLDALIAIGNKIPKGQILEKDRFIEITGSAQIVSASDLAELKLPDSSQWQKKLFEHAGFDFEKIGKQISDSDYLYVASWLCHAGSENANANKAVFLAGDLYEVLQKGQLSPYSPVIVDINHTEIPALGFVLGGYVGKDERAAGDALGLKVFSVLLNWGPYKEAGNKIIELNQSGELVFSMSCIPEYCVCAQCGHLSKSRSDACSHVKDMENSEGKLILRHPKFYTSSIIVSPNKPADTLADATGISDNLLDVADANSKNTVEEEVEKDLEKKATEDLKAKIAELETENAKFRQSESAQKIEALDSQAKDLQEKLESANAEISKISAQLAESQSKVKSLEEEKTSLEGEIQKREEAEKKAKFDARIKELEAIALSEDERKFYSERAKSEPDEGWAIMVGALLKTAKPQESEEKEDERLKASREFGGLVGGGPSTTHLSGLRGAVKKNT